MMIHTDNVLIYLVFLSALTVQCALSDLCIEVDEESLAAQLHRSAGPRAGRYAGLYKHGMIDGRNVTSLTDCLLACCTDLTCNSIFFHQDHCYLIACNHSTPDGCDSTSHDEEKFQDTYYIQLRTIDETVYESLQPSSSHGSGSTSHGSAGTDGSASHGSGSTSHGSSSTDGSASIDDTGSDITQPGTASENTDDPASSLVTECDMETNDGCGINQRCNIFLTDAEIRYMCECGKGYQQNRLKQCVVRSSDLSCEVGIAEDCLDHEQCKASSGRSRMGQCMCEIGYERDQDTSICLSINVNKKSHSDEQPETTTEAPQTQPPTMSSSVLPEVKTPTPVINTQLAPLVVSAGESQEITLPKDDITLHAFVIPNEEKDGYQYQWSLVSETNGKDVGEMVGINTDSLQLSHLIAGLYTFKVVVTAEGKYGEALVNVTVNPPKRINVAPIAVIKPASQSVTQPNDVVLDGSESTDDDKITVYHWEPVSKPMEAPGIPDQDMDKSILVLKGLAPGDYKYKLTVTDSDGGTNFTFANVTVVKENDYPPIANAGSNVIINLPQNSVTLYGNASTDDKGIASYEWIKKSIDKLTADMKGVRTSALQLEDLEEGDYIFELKVTDTAGQISTADVHVIVKAEHNKPPVARPGQNKTVWLPQNMITLDASNSSDDQRIDSYQWTQVSGPSSIVIENADRSMATAPNLVQGVYKFKLTVTDNENLQGSGTVYITVKQDANLAPVARAGGNYVFMLPTPIVYIDGSRSTDDRGIVSWQWARSDDSLAAGVIVNGSDQHAMLVLADLVSGRYVFTLEVQDADGLSGTDTATVTVNPEKNKEDLVELRLATNIHSFTELNKKSLQSQLAILLHKQIPNTNVHIQELEEDKGSGNLLVVFYAYRDISNTPLEVIPGTMVASALRDRLWSDQSLLDFRVVMVDTLVCQNNCTDHGNCDQNTKLCVCEAFWMSNPFQAYIGGHSNCEWSVLYVIIIAFLCLVTLIGVIWGLIFLCKRWYFTRPKKRHRYTLLDDGDEVDDKNNLELVQKVKLGKMQSSSLMISESDFSSDEETLFINKKANGHAGKNGLVRPGKAKVKA